MFTFEEILYIIIIHWVADFIFQDEKWATEKSKSIKMLLYHTSTYSVIWFFMNVIVVLSGYGKYNQHIFGMLVFFPLVTFIFHTITDFFTSKLVSKLFKNGELGSSIPNFGAFTYIGYDQVLHYIQLFLTLIFVKYLY